jgi:hypothetical protein
VRTVAQAFHAAPFVARQLAVKRPPRDCPLAGHLAHRPTVGEHSLDRFVPLLSHARVPHVRERDKSAEVAVTHHPKVCDTSAERLLGRVSRTCTILPGAADRNRTRNLLFTKARVLILRSQFVWIVLGRSNSFGVVSVRAKGCCLGCLRGGRRFESPGAPH